MWAGWVEDGGDVPFPKPTWKAVPTARLWCPPTAFAQRQHHQYLQHNTPTEHSRFVLNQHTIIGMAEYVPIAARKSAPYCRCRLSCTTRRMTKPASETAVVASTNTYRIRSQSDAVAESIASANAHAHGGTDSSWVRIWPYPRLWMIVGAK